MHRTDPSVDADDGDDQGSGLVPRARQAGGWGARELHACELGWVGKWASGGLCKIEAGAPHPGTWHLQCLHIL